MNTSKNCSHLPEGITLTFDADCISTGLRIFHGCFLFLILLASLTGNFTVLALVFFHKKLRYRSVLVTLGLVVADILISVVWVFQAEASIIVGMWPFKELGCSILSYFYVMLLYVRWCEIFTLTKDRFCQILFPYYYERWARGVVIFFSVMSWVIPAITGLIVPIIGNSSYYITLTACTVNCGDNSTCSLGVTTLFGLYFLLGGILPTISYVIIYVYGRKKKIEMRRNLYMGTGEGIPENSKVYHISSQERRALTTCLLVFITTTLTNIPLYVTSALKGIRPDIFEQIPIEVHFVVTYIFLLGTVLDPMVVMRNKDFRTAMSDGLLCCRGKQVRGTVSLGLKSVVTRSFVGDKPPDGTVTTGIEQDGPSSTTV